MAPLFRGWQNTPLPAALLETCRRRLAAHGDWARWQQAIASLPDIPTAGVDMGDTVAVRSTAAVAGATREALSIACRELTPWRKGPFDLFGLNIDTEWRSDWKWQRVAPHLASLKDKTILDVGCGNGYFGWRMLEAGAAQVTGIDPTVLFVMQHAAVERYVDDERNTVLPVPLEAIDNAGRFDVVFSMGVIYHRRDPTDHLDRLAKLAGETLVVESLIVDDDYAPFLQPKDRYARMRNVWWIPTTKTLEAAIIDAGFREARTVDVTVTRTDEQRTTDWMPFESLADALDAVDDRKTIEGYPAPKRAVIIARR